MLAASDFAPRRGAVLVFAKKINSRLVSYFKPPCRDFGKPGLGRFAGFFLSREGDVPLDFGDAKQGVEGNRGDRQVAERRTRNGDSYSPVTRRLNL